MALSAGLWWSHTRAANRLCTDIDVSISNADSTMFVTPEGVLKELEQLGFKLKGKPMYDIDADRIEQALRRSEFLEDVDCIKGLDGHLLIKARQLVPVIRVFDGSTSYYVNRNGKRMPVTANYHTDVPVVHGHFEKSFPVTNLLPLIDYVENDTLLHSLVTMYSVADSNNVFIIPAIYGHVVNMGDMANIESKFDKLKLFYTKVMPVKGWQYYDTISVKWNHQVVATRRVKASKPVMPVDDGSDDTVDFETMSLGGETQTLATDNDSKKKKPN